MNRWLVWWRSGNEPATEFIGWSAAQIMALREAAIAILTDDECRELAVIEFPGYSRPCSEVRHE